MSTRGSWANADTPALPREGRVFMYLGYILPAATVLNWAVASHDLDRVHQLTGGAEPAGFDRFGMPLLYAVFLLKLVRPEAPRDDSAAL